jgi:serine/threonine-protein kinase
VSDVYALGVVAYQCLAGRRPFEGASPIEIAVQHVEAVPPPLPPDVPPAVRSLVERCLAKAPGARFPSAAALASAARAAGAGPGLATQPIHHAPPTQPVSPGPTATATRPMSRTQIMAPQAGTQQQPYPQYRPVPQPQRSAPERNRAAVIVLAIVLGLLVMLVSALIASAVKRHHYATRSMPPIATAIAVTSSRVPPGGGGSADHWAATVRSKNFDDHAMTEGLTR